MRRKLLSLAMVISIGICAVGCGSNSANEVSTVATTEQTTTQETIVAETTENVKQETTTAKTYDYPTTVEDAEKEFGFTAEDAKSFINSYFVEYGVFLTEFPSCILAKFDSNSDKYYDDNEYKAILDWCRLYYDTSIENVSNNNKNLDDIEAMYMYKDYNTNGIFTFNTTYEDGSEVEDLSQYYYHRGLTVGRAESNEMAAEMYEFTVEEADIIVDEKFNNLSIEEKLNFYNLNDKIVDFFDNNKDGIFDEEEFDNFDSWATSVYNHIGDNDTEYDDFEWMNLAYDIKNNNKLILPYLLPNGDNWRE